MNLDIKLNLNINFLKTQIQTKPINSLPVPPYVFPENWTNRFGSELNMLIFLDLLNGNEMKIVKDYLN